LWGGAYAALKRAGDAMRDIGVKLATGLFWLGVVLAVSSAQAQEISHAELLDRMKAAIAGGTETRQPQPPAGGRTRTLRLENSIDPPQPVVTAPSAKAPVESAPPLEPGWGDVGSFDNIQFDLGSAQITSSSVPMLIKIANVMKDSAFDGRVFLIVGHTDASGNAKANLALSERRAASVVAFLKSQSVAPARLFSKGRGHTQPSVPGDAFSPKNRRVQVMISL
jgi:OOP family OmpA-OmpF porin